MVGICALIAVVFGSSPLSVSHAEGDDILKEIAGYKSWQRINKSPIMVEIVSVGDFTIGAGDLGG